MASPWIFKYCWATSFHRELLKTVLPSTSDRICFSTNRWGVYFELEFSAREILIISLLTLATEEVWTYFLARGLAIVFLSLSSILVLTPRSCRNYFRSQMLLKYISSFDNDLPAYIISYFSYDSRSLSLMPIFWSDRFPPIRRDDLFWISWGLARKNCSSFPFCLNSSGK